MSKDMNKHKEHPDLSNIDGTFASAVENNSRRLAALINDKNSTADDVRDFVYEMMDNCRQTPWIRKARLKMEKMDKVTLTFFVYNSFLSGENLKAVS